MPLPLTPADAVLLLMALAALAIWAVVWLRWRNRRPVLPYEPRRIVPWRLGDVAMMALVYIVVPVLLALALRAVIALPAAPAAGAVKTNLNSEHWLAQALLRSENPWVILLCIVAATAVAPIAEELLFRLLLQGWLESVERRVRRRVRFAPSWTTGILPVGVASLVFAALHIRVAAPQEDLSTLVFQIGVVAAASVLTVAVMIAWLRLAAGATLADFGIVPGKAAADLRLGFAAFLALTAPVYLVWIDAEYLLPANVVPDPFAIFALSLGLGTLYYRTHRILPCIVLHVCFNAAGVAMALLSSPG
jgi:membrane protease YdiL (CAAX protease family)